MKLYPTVFRNGGKVKKNLRRGEVVFAKYPNGEIAFAAKNKIGVFRMFDLSCARLAVRFASGRSNEDKY